MTLLLIVMMRSQKPLCLKADIIGEMSVETFKTVSCTTKPSGNQHCKYKFI